MKRTKHIGTLKLSSIRLEALELIRQINYDYNPVNDRLQRILEVAEFIPIIVRQ